MSIRINQVSFCANRQTKGNELAQKTHECEEKGIGYKIVNGEVLTGKRLTDYIKQAKAAAKEAVKFDAFEAGLKKQIAGFRSLA